MLEFGIGLAFQFGGDAVGEDFAEFDAPLVEGIDVPDDALDENAVLVEGDDFAEGGGVSRRARIVLLGRLPSNIWCGTSQSGDSFRLGLHRPFCRMPGLRPGQRHWPSAYRDAGPARFSDWQKPMKSHGDQARALMDELIEGVLAVGAGLAPKDRAGLIFHALAVERDASCRCSPS